MNSNVERTFIINVNNRWKKWTRFERRLNRIEPFEQRLKYEKTIRFKLKFSMETRPERISMFSFVWFSSPEEHADRRVSSQNLRKQRKRKKYEENNSFERFRRIFLFVKLIIEIEFFQGIYFNLFLSPCL